MLWLIYQLLYAPDLSVGIVFLYDVDSFRQVIPCILKSGEFTDVRSPVLRRR